MARSPESSTSSSGSSSSWDSYYPLLGSARSPGSSISSESSSEDASDDSNSGMSTNRVEDLSNICLDTSDDEDSICNICLFRPRDPIITHCGHLFCLRCLSRWLYDHSPEFECPTCRRKIVAASVPRAPTSFRNLRAFWNSDNFIPYFASFESGLAQVQGESDLHMYPFPTAVTNKSIDVTVTHVSHRYWVSVVISLPLIRKVFG
ncbi:hypothetical protein KSP40_PGU020593 [Platanthera guangdongensis]|uniref:E3 ubiquitin-protein ligase RMA n=1 Tax=Platanthera guangdongensis TaxID=2320717 RepID=A0ABR2LWF9_9ASPA